MSSETPFDRDGFNDRPWRVHRSSVAVGFLVLLPVGLIVLPGETQFHVPFVHQYVFPVEVRHGWPLTFLEREVDWKSPWYNKQRRDYPDYGHWGIPWLATESWSIWQASERTVSWLAAFVDAGVMLGIVGLVTAASEWRRRRRARFFQFSILELLLAFAAIAAGAGWFAWQRQEFARESDHTLAIDSAPADFPVEILLQEEDFSPIGLGASLAGPTCLTVFFESSGRHWSLWVISNPKTFLGS